VRGIDLSRGGFSPGSSVGPPIELGGKARCRRHNVTPNRPAILRGTLDFGSSACGPPKLTPCRRRLAGRHKDRSRLCCAGELIEERRCLALCGPSFPFSAGLICGMHRNRLSGNARRFSSGGDCVRLVTSQSQSNYLAVPVVVPAPVVVPVRRTSRRSCRPVRRASRRSCRPVRRS